MGSDRRQGARWRPHCARVAPDLSRSTGPLNTSRGDLRICAAKQSPQQDPRGRARGPCSSFTTWNTGQYDDTRPCHASAKLISIGPSFRACARPVNIGSAALVEDIVYTIAADRDSGWPALSLDPLLFTSAQHRVFEQDRNRVFVAMPSPTSVAGCLEGRGLDRAPVVESDGDAKSDAGPGFAWFSVGAD